MTEIYFRREGRLMVGCRGEFDGRSWRSSWADGQRASYPNKSPSRPADAEWSNKVIVLDSDINTKESSTRVMRVIRGPTSDILYSLSSSYRLPCPNLGWRKVNHIDTHAKWARPTDSLLNDVLSPPIRGEAFLCDLSLAWHRSATLRAIHDK